MEQHPRNQPGFIISVGDDNATSTTDDFAWFILRAQKSRPFDSLRVGVPLYWYDPAKEAIFLLSQISRVEQFEYKSIGELCERLIKLGYNKRNPATDPYFIKNAEKRRYCVAFWVRPLQQLNLPKPSGCNLDRDGWLPSDSDGGRCWLSPLESIDTDGHYGPQLRSAAVQINGEGYFDLAHVVDERQRRLQEVVQRRGQPAFRAALIRAYEGRCAVTNYDAEAALEAAHIVPYLGPQSNHVSNGLLLRADIHTLFDLDLIGVEPETLEIMLAPQLRGTCYDDIKGRSLAVTSDPSMRANKDALRERWKRFVKGTDVP